MACPRCSFQLTRATKKPRISTPARRAFHSSPHHQRLGAFTHAQEWNTATYHYNKSTAKTLPVALNHVDDLLTAYATQQKRRVDPSNPLYNQITRNNIAAQRRQPDKVLISKSTAKDFGDRVEVTAFVFDGAEAAEMEREARMKKRMGVKEGGQQVAQGNNRRGPPARRRVGGGGGAAGSDAARAGGGGVGGRPGGAARAPVRRSSGAASGLGSGASSGGGLIRRVQQ